MAEKCPRCRGRKEIYKVGSAYTLANMGGEKVKCPLCMGVGVYTMPCVKKGRTKTGAGGKTDVRAKQKAKPDGVST